MLDFIDRSFPSDDLLFFSANAGGDALERASITAQWVAHPSLKFVYESDWMPLHFWLMGILALLLRNAELSSRLLSLLCGVASLWFVWKIARMIYTETAANFSLLVFAFYTLHIGYSTTSSSEVPYLFFVLAGLLCFLNYERSLNGRWLALSGVWFTLGAAIRPEAWLIILGMGLILLGTPRRIANRTFWRSEHLSSLALFIASAGFWPLVWMGFWWVKYKNPLFFLAQNHGRVLQELAGYPTSALYRAAFFPGVLLLTISPLGLTGALTALWLAIRRSRGRQIVALLLIVGIMQLSEIATGGLATRARYTITLGTLLTILSGYGLEHIGRRHLSNTTRAFSSLIVVVLVINLGAVLVLSEMRWRFSEKFASISPRLRFARYITDLGNALRPRLGPADALVIDNYNEEPNEVAEVAGLPLLHGSRVFDAAAKHQDLRTELGSFIDTKHPRYLVYSDKGLLRRVLDFPSGCPLKPVIDGDLEFRCVFANEIYVLYEIHYRSLANPIGVG